MSCLNWNFSIDTFICGNNSVVNVNFLGLIIFSFALVCRENCTTSTYSLAENRFCNLSEFCECGNAKMV